MFDEPETKPTNSTVLRFSFRFAFLFAATVTFNVLTRTNIDGKNSKIMKFTTAQQSVVLLSGLRSAGCCSVFLCLHWSTLFFVVVVVSQFFDTFLFRYPPATFLQITNNNTDFSHKQNENHLYALRAHNAHTQCTDTQ